MKSLQRQNGFIQLLTALVGPWMAYAIIAAVVAAAVWGAYSYVDHHWETTAGIQRGSDEKKAEWDRANAKAEKDRKEQKEADAVVVAGLEKGRKDAEKSAKEWEAKWRQAKNDYERKGTALSNTTCPPASPGVPAGVPDTRVTWAFVGLYDGAHQRTDGSGQPLFGNPASIPPAGASAAASSPYGLSEVLDTHQENAVRWTACRRDLNYLIDVIEKLQKNPRKG